MDKSSVGPRKVLRAPALRRGREIIPISNRVKLERVIGLTVSNNAAFDCDPNSSIVAYAAGCVVVVYNVRKNKQSHILSSSKPSKKTITSLAFSYDGKYLATGECGHQPHVRVWDVQENTQVAEFQGHKYGINCVAFSPNLKYVVSVGSQHDMIVNVWDWKNNIKVASNKVSCKVKALSFASNGNYFVTVGNRHVKFWYLEYSRSAKYEPVPLMGRSAILGDQRNNYFCDVACGKGEMVESTYAITKSGLLCEFNSRRLLDKWVELRTTSANSISVGDSLIVIGCAEGVIRCFNPTNLNFISTLPRPHTLGIDVAKGVIGSKPASSHQTNAKYPDTIAVALDEINRKVTCIYNDHSFYVWDIKDVKKVGKSHSFMYHSACIWGIEVYPEVHENEKNILPKGTFLTCSSDDTIRFWNLETEMEQDTMYHKNVYSSELLKVLYVDPELSYLCDTDLNSSGSNDKVDATYDGKNGVRCLRISPDGRSLASGDRSGNIRIHDLEFVDELCKIEAHDSEVLCLEYSKPISITGQEKRYLASASRDRLIHVFDVKQDYTFQQTLDDHSSSITAVRFVQSEDTLQMISCGADKSIIFRKATFNPQLSLLREHHVVGKTTLYDMEVDMQQKHILTACQDRNIRVYSVQNGKHIRCFRGSQAEDGTLIKVVLDSSGTYLATSCTDKSLYLYDYITGECLATMYGHSELVTGLKFTNDGRHLISVSGDGCIFVWKLPTDVTQTMLNKQILIEGSGLPSLWQDGRKSAVAVTKPLQLMENGNGEGKLPDELDLVNHNAEASPLGYRFSMGQLPLWAKKQMLEKLPDANENQNLPPPIPPRGRWAQRIDGQGLVVRSYLDGDSVIPFPNPPGDLENSVIKEQSEESSTPEFSKVTANASFEVSEQNLKEILNGAFTEDSHGSVSFGQSINSLNSLHNRRSRLRSLPNTSSMRLEDVDAEDERSDSEVSEMVYYPVSEDGSDATDVAFQVCGNSERNAKESGINHTKKPRPERMLSDVPVINTPEQETNSDEEDFSPMVESDRSFLSSLCISTENLERLGQREKFMKSNYESLEKGESVESNQNELMEKNFCRQSISAKYLAGSLLPMKRPLANGVLTKSVAPPERQMSTPTRKREELLKALSDARKKLETVGFRRGLSSSKSIADLHSTPDREMFKSPRSPGEIRKAASMTDLSFKAQSRSRIFSPDNSRDEPETTAPLWNQSKMYPIDTSPPDSPNLNSSSNSCSNQAVREEAASHPEQVSRSNSSSSLYNRNQNASSSLYKTSSVYSLDRASPRFNANLSLYRSSQSPSSTRSSLPSIPPKPSMVPTALATDSSSDSSPSESTPIKSGRPVVAPRPFPLRNRHFSLSESNHSDDGRRTSMPVENGGLQKLRLKSRSEWDLKNSLAEDSSKGREDSSWQSNRYLSFSPRKNHMRPLKLGHSGVSALHSTPISSQYSEEKEFYPDQSLFFSMDPSSVPLTLDLCDNIASNLIRVSSFAMQVYQRLKMSSDLPLEVKTAMSNTLDQSVSQAQQILRPAIPPSWLNSANEPQRLPGLNFAHTNGNDLQKPLPHSVSHPEGINNLLEQYSNQLLRMFEQKMSSSQDKPNNNY